jgi:hypothetical protein
LHVDEGHGILRMVWGMPLACGTLRPFMMQVLNALSGFGRLFTRSETR